MFVSQHSLVFRAPVDLRVFAVSQPPLVHLQEHPLIPVVVLRVAGVQYPIPVKGAGVATHRYFLLFDVVVGPRRRIDAAFDGGVLSRQPKRVPTDRVHDVAALLHPVARHHITEGVGLGVTHVQVTRGVGEHVEHIHLLALVVGVPGTERLQLVPDGQPALLQLLRVVDLLGRVRGGIGTVGHGVLFEVGRYPLMVPTGL